MRLARLAALVLVAATTAPLAIAKLPPPSDEAKAKAAEAAAKAAWGGKVEGYKLCVSMERVAAAYQASVKQAGKEVKPPTPTPACADPGPYVSAAAAPVAAAAPAAAASAAPTKP